MYNLLVSTLDAGVASIDSENVIVSTPVLELYVADEKHGRLSIALPEVGTVPDVVPGVQDKVIKPLFVTVPPAELLSPVPPVFAILIVAPELFVTVPLLLPEMLFIIPLLAVFAIVIVPPELLIVEPEEFAVAEFEIPLPALFEIVMVPVLVVVPLLELADVEPLFTIPLPPLLDTVIVPELDKVPNPAPARFSIPEPALFEIVMVPVFTVFEFNPEPAELLLIPTPAVLDIVTEIGRAHV